MCKNVRDGISPRKLLGLLACGVEDDQQIGVCRVACVNY